MSNENLLNIQIKRLAEFAITLAHDKFGQSLDFTENSIQSLETLLQQEYKRINEFAVADKLLYEEVLKTSRIWGAYLGELIRCKRGGTWSVKKNDVFLVVDGQEIFPLFQVHQRITGGPQYNVATYYYNFAGDPNNINQQSLIDFKNENPENKQRPNLVEEDEKIKCPRCGGFMPNQYSFCTKCGYDLADRTKVKSWKSYKRKNYSVSPRISNSSMMRCPKCQSYKVTDTCGTIVITIIIHLVLTLITSGIWLFVILIYYLLKPAKPGRFECKSCGYAWG